MGDQMSKTVSSITTLIGLGVGTILAVWLGINNAWDAFTLYFGAVVGVAMTRLSDHLRD
jgi:positive regulator of sigma E activity